MEPTTIAIIATSALALAQLPLTVQFFRDAVEDYRLARNPDFQRRLKGDFTPCQGLDAPILRSFGSTSNLNLPQQRQGQQYDPLDW